MISSAKERANRVDRGPRRWDEAAPWVLSAAIHVGLIITGFFVVWTSLPEAPGPARTAMVSFAPTPQPRDAAPDAARETGSSSDIAPPPQHHRRVDARAPTVAETLSLPSLRTDAAASPELGVPAPSLAGLSAPTGVQFFGVGARDVRSIVYVVDASGSMVTTFPFVLDELERSASALDSLQRFQVIFFRGDSAGRAGRVAAPDPVNPSRSKETRLIRCTPEHIRSVLTWARSVRPSGRSDPMEALRVAISLQPDAIILLSSSIQGAGQWEVSSEAVLRELDALNPRDRSTGERPISIMTVQILEEDPSGLVRAIGAQHGPPGTGYRFVSRKDFER